jgi:hypothetical protein
MVATANASKRASSSMACVLSVLLAAVGTVASHGSANACDSASCSLVTRGQNGLMPKRGLRFDLSYAYTDLGARLSGSQKVAFVERPRVDLGRQKIWPAFHREYDGSEKVASLDVSYGLTSKLTLVGSLPAFAGHSHDIAHFGLLQEYSTGGNGDLLIGARYALGPRGLVGGVSIKLPTGSYRVGGEFGGGILDPTLQPGSGSFDWVTSLQYSRHARPLALTWSVAASYQATTSNSLGYRFGDLTILNVGVSRPLTGRLSASVQAKVFHQQRSKFLDLGVPSTGGTLVYLTPGLRFNVAAGASIYGYVQLLPYRYVNEAQLAPRAAILTGLSKSF